MLGDRGAAFHPVAAIHIADAEIVMDGGVMDMTADNPLRVVLLASAAKARSYSPM